MKDKDYRSLNKASILKVKGINEKVNAVDEDVMILVLSHLTKNWLIEDILEDNALKYVEIIFEIFPYKYVHILFKKERFYKKIKMYVASEFDEYSFIYSDTQNKAEVLEGITIWAKQCKCLIDNKIAMTKERERAKNETQDNKPYFFNEFE